MERTPSISRQLAGNGIRLVVTTNGEDLEGCGPSQPPPDVSVG